MYSLCDKFSLWFHWRKEVRSWLTLDWVRNFMNISASTFCKTFWNSKVTRELRNNFLSLHKWNLVCCHDTSDESREIWQERADVTCCYIQEYKYLLWLVIQDIFTEKVLFCQKTDGQNGICFSAFILPFPPYQPFKIDGCRTDRPKA